MIKSPKLRRVALRINFLADQGLFSVANFLLTVVLAHQFSVVELAAYGVGLSFSLMLLGIQRNCYLVHNAVLLPRLMRRRARFILGLHFSFSAIIIISELVIALLLHSFGESYYMQATMVATLATTLVYSQLTFDRMMMVKHERYITPLVTTILFALLTLSLFVVVPFFHLSFYAAMALIGLHPVLKMFWLIRVLGWPDFRVGFGLMIRSMRKYFLASLSGLAGASGYTHFPLIILGASAAPLQSAAFVAMRGLTQPLQIFARSLDIVDKNFFQHKPVMTPADVRAVLLRQMIIYSLPSLALMVFFMMFGKTVIGLTYGQEYRDFSGLLIGCTLVSGIVALSFPLETGIVRLKKLNLYNTYRLLAGAAGCGAAFLLCQRYGASGALVATLSGTIISVLCGVWLIRDVFFLKAPVVQSSLENVETLAE